LNRQNLHENFGLALRKYIDVGLTYNPVGELAVVIGDNLKRSVGSLVGTRKGVEKIRLDRNLVPRTHLFVSTSGCGILRSLSHMSFPCQIGKIVD
jgi:hypothetical protein